jgi:hypothetical protein
MGEQSIQPETGMLRETETDRSSDSLEPVGSGNKQEHDLILDIDGNPIHDAWQRASLDSPLMAGLEDMAKMLGHVVITYTKTMEKQLKALKRF